MESRDQTAEFRWGDFRRGTRPRPACQLSDEQVLFANLTRRRDNQL